MTKQWEQHKAEICRLYLSGLTIEAVRQHMIDKYGFEASVSTYRHTLPLWGVLKRRPRRPASPLSAVSRDSGYASESVRASWSTQASGISDNSSIRHYPPVPSIPSRHAPSYSFTRSRSTLSEVSDHAGIHSGDTPLSREQSKGHTAYLDSHTSDTSRYEATSGLNGPPSLGAGFHDASAMIGSENKTSYKPSKPLPPLPSGYYPPHAPPSRCRISSYQPYGPSAEEWGCQYCGSSRGHYLATVAKTILSKETLVERIRTEVSDINAKDVFGNTPLHFLAGSSPSLEQIKLFYTCGADFSIKNAEGETFLHVLDPEALGSNIAELLLWLVNKQFDLRQRTHHGETILHALLQRITSLDIVISILPIFQSVKNNINTRNNRGLSPVNCLFSNWIERRRAGEVSDEKWAGLITVLQFYVPGLDLINLHIIHDKSPYRPQGRTPSDSSQPIEHPKLRQPSENFENDDQLQSRDLELLNVVHQATTRDPLAQDGRGRNALNCLAYIIRLLPAYQGPQLPTTRLQYLNNCLDCQVDPNDFDCRGSTPLHSFISKPRSNENEPSMASLVEALIQAGADVNMHDRDGDTPLHLACKAGLLPCVEVILKHNPNLRARNYSGRSIIEEAEYYWQIEHDLQSTIRIQFCIERLRQAGAADHPVDDEDRLATDVPDSTWTAESGNTHLVDRLKHPLDLLKRRFH